MLDLFDTKTRKNVDTLIVTESFIKDRYSLKLFQEGKCFGTFRMFDKFIYPIGAVDVPRIIYKHALNE